MEELEFYLVQLAPGTERAFCKQHLTSISHWKALGKYDVLAAVPQSQSQSFEIANLQGQVQDFIQIRFFSDPEAVGQISPFERLTEVTRGANWIAMSLLKMAPRHVLGPGRIAAVSEQALAKQVSEWLESQQFSFQVLRTYGWHELAVILASDNLGQLAIAADQLGCIMIDGTPALTKTFTVFALDYEFLRCQGEKKWAILSEPISQLRMGSYLTCKREPSSAMLEDVRKTFGSAVESSIVFGAEDILLVAKPSVAIGRFLEGLVSLRDTASTGDNLLATTTFVGLDHEGCPSQQLTRKDEAFDEMMRQAWSLSLGIDFDEQALHAGGDDADVLDVRRTAARLNTVLRGSLQNGLTCDAYIDMIPALASIRRRPLQSLTEAKVIMDYLAVGYQQRVLGTFNTLWNTGNPAPLVYRAGIQRVLWATQHLCQSLLARRGRTWSGFVVFGFVREYFRTHRGIINIPSRAMFDPGEWWGVFHEIGHEYVSQVERDSPDQWSKLIEASFGISAQEYQGRDIELLHCNEFASEVLSDVFDLSFGFHNDWGLYCEVVFDYVAKLSLARAMERRSIDRRPLLSEGSKAWDRLAYFMARLAAVYWYHFESSATECPYGEFRDNVTGLLLSAIEGSQNLGEHREEISKEARRLLDGSKLRSLFRTRYQIGAILGTDTGRKLLGMTFPAGTADNGAAGARQAQALAALRAGKALPQVDEPERIICELARCKRVGPSEDDGNMRLATILSFWNSYASRLPSIIHDALRGLQV